MVQERLKTTAIGPSFALNVNESARDFLLVEGTDARYGARHLKRAIEHLLVQPLANLIASGQIRLGDYIRVSHRHGSPVLLFFQEADSMETWNIAGRVAG
jgi:ATP-dependent Clp protease ATP-binding subunit ClpB